MKWTMMHGKKNSRELWFLIQECSIPPDSKWKEYPCGSFRTKCGILRLQNVARLRGSQHFAQGSLRFHGSNTAPADQRCRLLPSWSSPHSVWQKAALAENGGKNWNICRCSKGLLSEPLVVVTRYFNLFYIAYYHSWTRSYTPNCTPNSGFTWPHTPLSRGQMTVSSILRGFEWCWSVVWLRETFTGNKTVVFPINSQQSSQLLN